MLFGRKIRTEIPSVVESHCNSEEYREEVGKKDDAQKRKMKIYADEKRGAKDVQLDIDDLVLVKQKPLNKSETAFNPLPYQVTDIKGTMVTAENKGHKVTRNSSHLKPLMWSQMLPAAEEEQKDLQEKQEMDQEVPIRGNKEERASKEMVTRRSMRERKVPNYLNDYETK